MNSIFIYDAFTNQKFGGNPAGIVFHGEKLEKEEKQNLAKELGFSETVFISFSDEADWQFEYFTPKQEVDLCGHATIAAIYALFDEKKLKGKDVVWIKTRLGILPIFLKKEGEILKSVWMEQDKGNLSYNIPIELKKILRSLGLEEKDVQQDIKLVKAYSGLWDLMIPLSSKESLDSIKINVKEVEEWSSKLGVISFHPFFLQGKEVYVRNFAPIVDIPEESATGTSNGALAFYLHTLDYLKVEEELLCHQGESLGRKSQILAKIDIQGNILVGGQAVRILKGEYQ